MFRLLGCAVVVAVLAGCGPGMERCESDRDCLETEYCVARVCLERSVKPDAGADAGVVDGGIPDAGTTQPTPDAGSTADAGAVDAGVEPTCELHDTRACCGGRGEQTCVQSDGGLMWDECDATKTPESCNGVDDDCDGTIDDELAWVAPDGGIVMSLECSAGVGACTSTGVYVCNASGAPVCGATASQPTTEVCDGADNDCDGATDEGTTIECLVDADNDRYAAALTGAVQLCPDTARADWGNCPTGYVAPGAAVDVDCDDSSTSVFRLLDARIDSDGDTACIGDAFQACAGTALSAGLRAPTACRNEDDCDDSSAAQFRQEDTRADADGDGFCVGGSVVSCVGDSAPAGRQLAANCQSATADDCDDNSASVYRSVAVKTDADNDAHCVGAEAQRCIGAAAPSGFRIASSCSSSTDCADNNPATFQNVSVKRDGDNDGHCLGTTETLCVGSTPPAGYKLSNQCSSFVDCDDSRGDQYRVVTMYPDADNDGYCTSAYEPRCVGNFATSPGFRTLEMCTATSDCAPSDSGKYRMENLRMDQDRDGYCSSAPATPVCIGATVQAPYRSPNTCNATNDVVDTNPNATTIAEQEGTSETKAKYCGSAPVSETLSISWSCPVGYSAVASAYTTTQNPAGSDAMDYPQASGQSGVATGAFRCKFASTVTTWWRVTVVCRANGL